MAQSIARNPQDTLKLLYEVSREFNSALDLRTVLQRVLFLTMKNIGANSGSIIVVDENGEPLESAIIHGSNVLDQTTQQLRITTERGLAGWVLKNGVAALVEDTSKDERWLRRPDDDISRTGPKSAISAPLLSRDRLVGVITLVNANPSQFDESHFSLVKAIADQAGIAVLNARLYSESQRQARLMSALAETAAFINASVDFDDVLQRIAAQTMQALNVQAVSLALRDASDETQLVFRAVIGGAGQSLQGYRLPVGQGISGWVAEHGQAVIIPDAHNDPRFDAETDRRTGYYTRAVACAPIRQDERVIGILEAINPNIAFEKDTLLVLEGICNLASTAIRHAELFSRLQAAHQRYRDLFNDSISLIVITDMAGKILEANRQTVQLSEYTPEALQQMSIFQLHQANFVHLGDNLEKLQDSQHTIAYESNLRTRSGYEIPVQVLCRRVFIEGHAFIQWILRDITERKNIDKLRNDLISMVYHDLRSPLANIISSLDVLRSMVPMDEMVDSVIQIAVRSTERIQRLTNSLLDVHRLESGNPIATQEIVSLHGIVNDAMDAVRLLADSKHQMLEVALPAHLPALYVDSDMIRRVLINLLENAIKYTPNDGRIRLEAGMEHDWVLVSVVDTGPGIPESEQELIFHKFTRLRNREGSKGLGLGLTFCRLAVEGHGGRIWVQSQVGVGSRFSITLPVAPADTVLEPPQA
ncbi:MAG: GAF domain-containing protein [Anaerolineales bacterium]